MIDHVGIRVADVARSKRFYEAVLKPLGYRVLAEFTAEQTGGHAAVGFGSERASFWIGDHERGAGGPTHVSFTAKANADVHAFHEAALASGGKDNGAPGPRPHYSAGFYGAFVLDPDGNNVEAVCRND